MATLVLSTVGTLLGGPVGGAIGSMLGQSIDQEIFGPGPRRGPRLGDLSVQTSSYGSAIPQIFGSMRVAGCIVWSTDLQERSNTAGAKGAPETITYSYSASFAVALSSREISGIGRIWADGKLIRTTGGEFTVATGFRVLHGTEDQAVDPLIGSIEGIDSTPAYRGVALAVFEDFELAEFGNRIPFLTFEVLADVPPISVSTVLSETSGGLILASTTEQVRGYAAYGTTITAAVQPLVDAFGMKLFDDGLILSSTPQLATLADEREMGCTATDEAAARSERSQAPAASLPSALTLGYYDPDRDYQSGIARAALDSPRQSLEQIELPAVIDASGAKALAETCLGRRWAERDKLRLRLSPRFLSLAPGTLIQPSTSADAWRVDQVTIDSLLAVVDLRPVYGRVDSIPADSGRLLSSPASVPTPTIIGLIELADDGTSNSEHPVVAIAATNSSSWHAVPLQVRIGAASFALSSAAAATVLGSALTVLPPGQSVLFDLRNIIDVQLANPNDWLESRDDGTLLSGANLAILGDEIIQFGDAQPLGEGCFRLSRLLRGRRGTEWAMGSHEPGEQFALLDPARLQQLPLTAAHVGATVEVTAQGLADANAAPVAHVVRGEAMRPPSPVHLDATIDPSGRVTCRWIRRSSQGWDWLDGVDAPLGLAVEAYRVILRGTLGEILVETGEANATFDASQVASVGAGSLELSVAQVGDLALSRPAILPISIS